MNAYLLKDISGKGLVLFRSSHGSSLFRKMFCQCSNFSDYVRARYVIGHDVIGHPEVPTDNSGLSLFDVENRLTIHGLHKNLWPN